MARHVNWIDALHVVCFNLSTLSPHEYDRQLSETETELNALTDIRTCRPGMC